ncbi:MAG: CHASE2 domain-containing protein, partial [Cyanobacteria bacterium P01_H01_bin.119]
MLGTRLANRYHILRSLGSGGFGQTYLARDDTGTAAQTPTSPLCVVKQLKPASGDSDFLKVARRLFETEVKTLKKLGKHDRIPQLLDSFEDGADFYLVQEFIEGTPLSRELKQRDRFDESDVIALLEDVLPLLKIVHDNHVIHRDIKPSNLIRRHSDGRLVLIDFGAVKEIRTQILSGQETTLTVGIGTQGYTPPEQLTGKPRYNSDLYGLGMTAIQSLTGVSPGQMVEDPQTSEFLWQSQADASVGLKLVLSKLVRNSYYYRYQSAADVLKDLARLDQLAQEFPAEAEIDYTAPWGMTTVSSSPSLRQRLGRLAITAAIAAGLAIGIRQVGGFQAIELRVQDALVRLQPSPDVDPRLLVVEITEADLRQQQRDTPSDQAIADAIQILQTHAPRAIGLDLHREISQPPGHEALMQTLQPDNTFTITKIGDTPEETIPPPEAVDPERVGFNDFVVDPDGVIRRSLLFSAAENRAGSEVLHGFSLRLAQKYLETEGIEATASDRNPEHMRLGDAVFTPIAATAGVYRQIDARGYQILLDYHSQRDVARQVSLSQVLAKTFDPAWVENKIVLIGMTAASAKDLFPTPYSAAVGDDHQMAGVMVHANMVHQILAIALGEQPLPWYWPDGIEILWLMVWGSIGAALPLVVQRPIILGISVGGGLAMVVAVSGISLSFGGRVPVIAPASALLLGG